MEAENKSFSWLHWQMIKKGGDKGGPPQVGNSYWKTKALG